MSAFLLRRGVTNNPQKSFSSSFPATENPMSQGGIWTQGGATGVDWTNVQTTPGLAFGTQTIHTLPPYDDSVACLSGFGPDQWCQGTIHNASSTSREVELLLRSTINAHSIIQYEVDITQTYGAVLVKWNGALNDFTFIQQGIGGSTNDGDVWYAQIVGNTITIKCNGSTLYTGNDSSITSGSPGMGFFADTNNGGSPTASNTFGWSSYSAGTF